MKILALALLLALPLTMALQTERKPAVGLTVMIVSTDDQGNYRERPAIVVGVRNHQVADLAAIETTAGDPYIDFYRIDAIEHDEQSRLPGTWHFVEE